MHLPRHRLLVVPFTVALLLVMALLTLLYGPVAAAPVHDSRAQEAGPADAAAIIPPGPSWVWSTYFGGRRHDVPYAMDRDAAGNVYIAGMTTTTDTFPIIGTTLISTSAWSCGPHTLIRTGFVAKLSPDGSQLLWSTFFGGHCDDWVTDMAVDGQGNVHIVGKARSRLNGLILKNPLRNNQLPDRGETCDDDWFHCEQDAFVAKFTSDGELVFSTLLGGKGWDEGRAIAVDEGGNIYVGLMSQSTDLERIKPLTVGSSGDPRGDAYIVQLTPDGQSIEFATHLGGNDFDALYSMDLAPNGDILVGGATESAKFPEQSAQQSTCSGVNCAWIARIRLGDPNAQLVYSTYLDGERSEWVGGIATDATGNAYVVGQTTSVTLPVTADAYDKEFNGGAYDGFVASYSPTGTVRYVTYLGGTSNDYVYDVAADGRGYAYVTGYTRSGDFPTTTVELEGLHLGGDNGFVSILDQTGSHLVYSSYVGGDNSEGGSLGDYAEAIQVDETGTIYLAGWTTTANFPTTPGTYAPTQPDCAFPSSCENGFVTKLKRPLPVVFVPGIGASALLDRLDNNHSLWVGYPADAWRLSLFASDVSTFTQEIVAPDVLRWVLGWVDIYGSFMNSMKDAGYREYNVANDPARRTLAGCDYDAQKDTQPNFFVFAYDWRQSNAQTAAALHDYIHCVRLFHSDSQINIVAHSMGGLVARRYILEYASGDSWPVVNAVVSIGSPYLGAAKMVNVLETGDFEKIVPADVTQRIIKSFPGAHQLLPTADYFALAPPPLVESVSVDLDGDGQKGETFDYAAFIDLINVRYGVEGVQPGQNGDEFHRYQNGLQDDWRDDSSGVAYYHAVGKQAAHKTIEQVEFTETLVWGGGNEGPPNAEPRIRIHTGEGDGTVPLISALRSITGTDTNAAWADVRVFDQGSDALLEHTALTRNPDVLAWMMSVLTPVPPVPNLAAARTAAPAPAHYVWIYGASAITVTDDFTGTTAPPPQFLEGLRGVLDGVEVMEQGSNQYQIILPSSGAYTISLTAADGPQMVEVLTGVGDNVDRATHYHDLWLGEGAAFDLRLLPAGAEPLRVDQDGDGAPETPLAPASDITGDDARDLTAPVLTVVTAMVDSQVRVTLTATDDASGVDAITYLLDSGARQTYSAPFLLNPEQVGMLYAYAQDRAGNRSALVKETVGTGNGGTGDSRVYLPALER